MIWSTDTMSWKKGRYLGTPPTSRFGHTSTAIGPHLLIFGGWEYTKAQNEIIVLRECTNRPEEAEEGDEQQYQDQMDGQQDGYGQEQDYGGEQDNQQQ